MELAYRALHSQIYIIDKRKTCTINMERPTYIWHTGTREKHHPSPDTDMFLSPDTSTASVRAYIRRYVWRERGSCLALIRFASEEQRSGDPSARPSRYHSQYYHSPPSLICEGRVREDLTRRWGDNDAADSLAGVVLKTRVRLGLT